MTSETAQSSLTSSGVHRTADWVRLFAVCAVGYDAVAATAEAIIWYPRYSFLGAEQRVIIPALLVAAYSLIFLVVIYMTSLPWRRVAVPVLFLLTVLSAKWTIICFDAPSFSNIRTLEILITGLAVMSNALAISLTLATWPRNPNPRSASVGTHEVQRQNEPATALGTLFARNWTRLPSTWPRFFVFLAICVGPIVSAIVLAHISSGLTARLQVARSTPVGLLSNWLIPTIVAISVLTFQWWRQLGLFYFGLNFLLSASAWIRLWIHGTPASLRLSIPELALVGFSFTLEVSAITVIVWTWRQASWRALDDGEKSIDLDESEKPK